jgi:hypothetical protein
MEIQAVNAMVVAVGRSATATFSKSACEGIWRVANLGVDGDAHQGKTTKRSCRVVRDPKLRNLRQVHLIHAELHAELRLVGLRTRSK